MADLFLRARRGQPVVARSVVPMDAARKGGRIARGSIRDGFHGSDSERAVGMVHRIRPLLRQLLLVLFDHMAAGLSGKGAPLSKNEDGAVRLAAVPRDRGPARSPHK